MVSAAGQTVVISAGHKMSTSPDQERIQQLADRRQPEHPVMHTMIQEVRELIILIQDPDPVEGLILLRPLQMQGRPELPEDIIVLHMIQDLQTAVVDHIHQAVTVDLLLATITEAVTTVLQAEVAEVILLVLLQDLQGQAILLPDQAVAAAKEVVVDHLPGQEEVDDKIGLNSK